MIRLACDWAFIVFGQSLVFDKFVEDRGGETARTPDGCNGDLFLSRVWGRHIVEIGLVRLPVPATALNVSGAWPYIRKSRLSSFSIWSATETRAWRAWRVTT